MPIPVLQRRLRDQSLARRGRRVQHPRLRSNAILAVLQLPRHRSTEASDGVEVHAEEVLVVLEVDGSPRKQEEEQSVLGRQPGDHCRQVHLSFNSWMAIYSFGFIEHDSISPSNE